MDVYFRKIESDDYYITEQKIKYCRPCAVHHNNGDFAVIDVDRIVESCKKNNCDFDLYFSTCISHELIHSIIERDISLDLSYKFDNLYQMLKSKKSPFHELGTGL
jgi:hypothetical protein